MKVLKNHTFYQILLVINSRKMRWAGHAERMEEPRNAYRNLVGEPEGKTPLERP
jgi:hypothetical protein